MGRPSNPQLMARVLEAVKHLGETKGSSARQVLELLRQGNKPPTRNLAMQVQRALKNAVTAGLLKLRSGRYKMLISLQNAVKNRAGGKANGTNKAIASNPAASKKKEDIENGTDSGSQEAAAVEAGPRSRCSHCKKHKRKASRRRRKRSSSKRGRKRPTKQTSERKSRKLRRRGEEEVTNRRERRRKMPAPGTRSKSDVPERKTNPDTNEEHENNESGNRRDRSESYSDAEGGEEVPAKTTKAKLSAGGGAGRKNDNSPSRRSGGGSKPRRSSRKRNSSVNKMAENDSEEAARMECCDGGEEHVEEDVNACDQNGVNGSRTSI